jgi:hypothetical protein
MMATDKNQSSSGEGWLVIAADPNNSRVDQRHRVRDDPLLLLSDHQAMPLIEALYGHDIAQSG